MNLIKIGQRYVNLDNVTNISPVNKEFAGEDGILQIEYTGRNSEDWGSEWVEGHEAQALLSWLNSIATNIVEVFEKDILAAESYARATAPSNDAEDRYNRGYPTEQEAIEHAAALAAQIAALRAQLDDAHQHVGALIKVGEDTTPWVEPYTLKMECRSVLEAARAWLRREAK